MGKTLLVLVVATVAFPSALPAQNDGLTASTLPEFLARYEDNLKPVDQAYEDLVNENLPLRDETGQSLGRRHIEDRRQPLVSLRQIARQLAADPQDLVLSTKLLFQTEALVDDLFDLSQIAYDNDREELGKSFADLQTAMDHQNELIEAYSLQLAAAKQDRIQQLEKENQELQQKLKEAAGREKSKPSTP